ncbi:DUF1638 domain-containing protein [Arenibacterium halophilum]|uniref:DUF1638 domain-containing protein n=1 Tax=Arenibacterium halophilum TaxID=2583821 RepID=A0ABY2XAI0_9RHOB|nr:DUF1638 domain-containing protein [Arenibacterium halophilum]TMV13380.1 DUF1638 domain-containing protein [Arenibacterium halophilum]
MADPAETDPDALTDTGLAPSGQGAVLVIACGALAREILAITRTAGWTHVDLACLPAILHNHPEKIAERVRTAVLRARETYKAVFVAYADCGTGGALKKVCDELGVEMISGPHCYSFFEGNAAFSAHEDEITAFYLTDFLARQFDAFVWKPLGLDRHPELIEMYFGNYTKLVYQSQIDDPALLARAQSCADRLGLDFEHRRTGFGELESSLRNWVTSPR